MATVHNSVREPNPENIFNTANAYQRSMALKAAIQLDLFTAFNGEAHTAESLAQAIGAPARGVRILSDFLVICGFLTKQGNTYELGPDAAMFLDRKSPAYFGGTLDFLLNPGLTEPFFNLTEVVRSGSTTLPDQGTVSTENPLWVEFARKMMPMMYPAALELAQLVPESGELRVLDIAAGHGIFGIAFALRNPQARITGLDWPSVLQVALENAERFGVADRYSTLPGDAFQVDFGGPYDVVLVPNFFHHFDQPTCEGLMRRMHAALADDGRCITLEFVPNEDRVSPPTAAAFAMMMLGTTPAGDAYTFSEYERMFRNAGFASSEAHSLARSPQTAIVSRKR